MAIILPVLFTYAMVGITFDYKNYVKENFAIYGTLYDKSTVKIDEKYSSQYKVIEIPKDVRDLYDIDARLSLRMKLYSYRSNSFIDNLIKNSIGKKRNDVEIQIYVQYQKSIVGIPEDAKPSYDLESRLNKSSSTHFVKRTRNGAIIQITLIFPCKSEDHRQKVLKVVLSHLQKSGTFDKNFIEGLQNVEKELGSDYPGFYFRQQYCAGCRSFLKNNLKDILETAENLNEMLKNNNGVPIKMELEDLSTVFKGLPAFEENQEIIKKLDEVEELYNDIKIARETFLDWDYDRPIPDDNDSEEEKMVRQFHVDLQHARDAFTAAIINLDISSSASINQFDEAYKAYGPTDTHDRFQKRLEEIQKKFDKIHSKH
ncbi:uncharacterized protein LOC111642113 [Centruroides sculpturatus]|uniref:uncharacterized protein LOC111642113 n=1 Tax=Centruroides sculpturatus TaxID=218467 RepID=UPI000C6DB71A|nr:uncharacterized protein LOC111642113 [Centruroides sculpturatus]